MISASPIIPPSHRFTTEQVLRGIQAFVSENCGEQVVIDPAASVYEYAPAARASHECPLEFLWDLARYFQLKWREERWVIWLKLRDKSAKTKAQRIAAWERWERDVAPTLTVRRLAEFIAKHAPAPSFEPISVLGRKCATAGVFVGLCELPEVKSRRVAPSTPLRALESSSSICDFWTRAQWISGASLPPTQKMAPWPVNDLMSLALLVVWIASIAIGIFMGTMLARTHGWLTGVFTGAVTAIIALCVGPFTLDRVHNPLPEAVKTFGDLARLIAKQRGTA